ncbi:MAG: LysR family transcriptional regulator [Clostridia bacterium]|nr:LysR family transcriptional regulator [Clostridia bacterium]
MNLLNVRTFLYIARYQTISGAAEAMYTTQPTVSSRLSQLEAELGVTLVNRHKGHRTVELTEKGQDFIPIAERWLALDRQTMQFCREDMQETFTLAAPASYQEHVVPQIVRLLMNQPLPPKIRLRTANSASVYTMVADHDADFGLATRLIVSDDIAAMPMFNTEYVLLLPADTPLPEGPVMPDLLDPRFEVSVTSWTGETRRWHDHYWDPYQPSYLQVDNNHMAHNYLALPQCWALCPASIAFSIYSRIPDRLTIRRLAVDPPKHHCYLIMQRAQAKNRPELVNQIRGTILSYAQDTPLLQPVDTDRLNNAPG